MNLVAFVLVVVAGALTAIQSGTNAQLVRDLNRPWFVAVLVSLVTTVAFTLIWLATGARLPAPGRWVAVPWWAWTGGLCGAAYVSTTLVFAGQLGAGVFTGLIVTAGLAGSVLVDQLGLVGFAEHAASPLRVLGVLIMVAGLVLVVRT